MRTTGVLRDISANGAGFLAGWIGRVEIAKRRNSVRNIDIDDARLDKGALVLNVDLENAVHAGERNNHAAPGCNGPSAQSRSCATAYNRNVVVARHLHGRHDIRGTAREHYNFRQRFIYPAVVLVKLEISWV